MGFLIKNYIYHVFDESSNDIQNINFCRSGYMFSLEILTNNFFKKNKERLSSLPYILERYKLILQLTMWKYEEGERISPKLEFLSGPNFELILLRGLIFPNVVFRDVEICDVHKLKQHETFHSAPEKEVGRCLSLVICKDVEVCGMQFACDYYHLTFKGAREDNICLY